MIVRLLIALLLVPNLFGLHRAEEDRRVPVTVVEVSGAIVVINRGTQAGLQRGDQVVFPRSGRPPLLGIVLRAHQRDARVELDEPEVRVVVGLRGEALVPVNRQIPSASANDIPDHPPWKAPVGIWEEGKPLLAPIASPKPEERPSRVWGRIYFQYEDTEDSLADRQTRRLRSGLDYRHANPFGHAGELRFKGDVYRREQDADGAEPSESTARIERLSYTLGTARGDRRRVEFGRFLPQLFPQFGVLDGAESLWKVGAGTQLGGSLGFVPGPNLEKESAEDLALALYGRWVTDPGERASVKLGLQKTWHDGEEDRDLIATGLHWRVAKNLAFRGSALFDHFDAEDTLEPRGFNLTEAHSSLDWQFNGGSGASVYAAYLDWPQLLREEDPELLPATIQNQAVLRTGASTTLLPSKRSRLFARYETWRDDVNSGSFADLRLDLLGVLYSASELTLGLFDTEGSFSSGLGARIRHTHRLERGRISLGYESTEYEQAGFLGNQSELQQQVLSLDVNSRFFSDLDVFAEAQQRFGDEQDSFTLRVRLTWHF